MAVERTYTTPVGEFRIQETGELYSAPPIEGASPPTEENLRAIEAGDTCRAIYFFALGNALARKSKESEAIESFRSALLEWPECATVHNNLGFVLDEAGHRDEALSHLRQASLIDSELILPYLHCGRILYQMGDYDAAVIAYERVVRLDPERAEGYIGLAEIARKRGEREQAVRWCERAYERNSKLVPVRNLLAFFCFEEGEKLFHADNIDGALALWAEGYSRYAASFIEDQRIVQGMAQLSDRLEEGKAIEVLMKTVVPKLLEPELAEAASYEIFSRLLLMLGLMPECYESATGLKNACERWRGQNGEIVNPYAIYRLGLVYCYQGEYALALEELRKCRDKLLPKKQASLKLARVIEFIGEVTEAKAKVAGRGINAAQQEWEIHGFSYPFQANGWKKAGLSPAEAARWRDSGVGAAVAGVWAKSKISPLEAAPWIKAGVQEPERAKPWVRAGILPDEAVNWEKYFPEQIDVAIQARRAGFTDPEETANWLKIFMFPWDAAAWRERGFNVEEARYWVEVAGIKDPFKASEEKSLLERELAELKGEVGEDG